MDIYIYISGIGEKGEVKEIIEVISVSEAGYMRAYSFPSKCSRDEPEEMRSNRATEVGKEWDRQEA
jgi:hypothetical protein